MFPEMTVTYYRTTRHHDTLSNLFTLERTVNMYRKPIVLISRVAYYCWQPCLERQRAVKLDRTPTVTVSHGEDTCTTSDLVTWRLTMNTSLNITQCTSVRAVIISNTKPTSCFAAGSTIRATDTAVLCAPISLLVI
jgi:hypothetical protein